MKEKLKSFLAAIGYFILAFAVQLVVSVFAGAILGIIYILNNSESALTDTEKMASYIIQFTNPIIIVSDMIIVLILFLIYHFKKRQIKTELLILKTKCSNLMVAILLGISVWCINSGVLNIINSLGLFQSKFESFAETTATLNTGNYFIAILATVFIAPFAEEFLFRGVIYRTLNRRFSIFTTIVVQALLFGILHGNLIQGIYATFLGIVFGYITYKSNSIWPAIISHTINNGIAMLLPRFLDENLTTISFYYLLLITGLIIFINSLFLIKKDIKKDIKNISFYNYI